MPRVVHSPLSLPRDRKRLIHSAAAGVASAMGTSSFGSPTTVADASSLGAAGALVLAVDLCFCCSAFYVAFSQASADVKKELGWFPTFSATPFLCVDSKRRRQATQCRFESFLSRITFNSQLEMPQELSSCFRFSLENVLKGQPWYSPTPGAVKLIVLLQFQGLQSLRLPS